MPTIDVDIKEDELLKLSPELLSALLKDHTTSSNGVQRNIFWATSDYAHLGKGYQYADPIVPERITGEECGNIIQPRTVKSADTQRTRSREMAEVFTPSWVCNAQNNLIDEEWFGRKAVFNTEHPDHSWTVNPDPITLPDGCTWRDYVRDIRLEITCGEAPYLVSRYDTTTGKLISLANRIGLLDRKLRVVSENTTDSGEWLRWAQVALKSVYGYEWQGDNLLLARENLLATFIDYYKEKFQRQPDERSLIYAAYIISWNLWQMDGLRGTVPDTCHTQTVTDLWGEISVTPCLGCTEGNIKRHNGKYCLIRDWRAKREKRKIRFIDLII